MYREGEHITALVTPAAVSPVSLDDMKEHLRVDGADENALIQAYINACASSLGSEGELGQALTTETWDESFKNPPKDVYLSVLPARSIVSVTYYDRDNVQQTATLSDFTLYSSDRWAFVRSDNWPGTYDRPDAITIRYTAGFGDDAADVPLEVVQAVKLIVAHWYQNRENTSELNMKEIPRAASHLLGLRRVGWYG